MSIPAEPSAAVAPTLGSDALLIDLPLPLVTPRLILHAAQAGNGPMINEAIQESIDDLTPWMSWANPPPTVEQIESWCRKAAAELLARRRLQLVMLLRNPPEGETGPACVGVCGIPRLNWAVPSFEIGYWVRRRFARQGFVTEAVNSLTEMLFTDLKAERVEICMDDRNERSWRVAERAGYTLEGVFRRASRAVDGSLRDSRVYAKVRE